VEHDYTPRVLFRRDGHNRSEFGICSVFLPTIELRSSIDKNDKILCRYSCLPFYRELEKDIENIGSSMYVPCSHHNTLSKIPNWYNEFSDLTPKTWFYIDDIDEDTPLFIKGEINSRKDRFKTHCYAANKQEAVNVTDNLLMDTLIQDQQMCYRKFEDFVTFEKSLSGIPVIEEYRFFIFNGKIIGSSFYWSSHEEFASMTNPNRVPSAMLDEIHRRMSKLGPTIYVVDIARTVSKETKFGNWMIIEFNDFQMSGLLLIYEFDFYSNLKKELYRTQ